MSEGVKPSEMSAATKTAFLNKLSPQSCIVVETTDDAKVNGANLIAAYTAAKALTPNGAAIGDGNRAAVIIPPGKYDLDHGEENACVPLTLDTEFVDIIGLTTDRSLQHIYGTPEATNSGVVIQTANDVHISNLTVEILTEVETANFDETDSSAYWPATDLNSTVISNCEFIGAVGESFQLRAMRWNIEYSGTFTNCIGGDVGFGYGGIASGTFTNCTGEYGSFGTNGVASGTFINCIGLSSSFGGNGTASGAFNNCTGGESSFGGGNGGMASGTFNNCTGGQYAFGGFDAIASGIFNNCIGGDNSFGSGDGGMASGTFTNCISGNDSFGKDGSSILSGTLSLCKMNGATFKSPVATVATVEIVDGGTLYEVDDELEVVGGTGTAATLKVASVAAGVIDGIEVLTVGAYTAEPSNPVSTTGHTGTATFNLYWNEGHIYGCVDSTGFIAQKIWNVDVE